MRAGTGYDIHRLVEGRRLVLGGVAIPSEKGEEAHSDGDVLLHALIDALLGAAALGDIGSHFPDTDPEYKDIESARLLERTLEMTGRDIVNIDATVFLERPKLRGYIDAIRESLSRLTGLDMEYISVKAKTAEGLGPVGEGKAVAAAVTVLLNS